MSISGMDGMGDDDVQRELERGAKFVVFSYTISLIVITFKRNSRIHFIRSSDSAFIKGLPYNLLTLFLGWWGFPWGPIYSIVSIAKNLAGGTNVTADVLRTTRQASGTSAPAQ